jgi:hypothetical protein
MCLCDAVVAHLGQELSYVLISGFRILPYEFGKVRHTKPPLDMVWCQKFRGKAFGKS